MNEKRVKTEQAPFDSFAKIGARTLLKAAFESKASGPSSSSTPRYRKKTAQLSVSYASHPGEGLILTMQLGMPYRSFVDRRWPLSLLLQEGRLALGGPIATLNLGLYGVNLRAAEKRGGEEEMC